METGNQWNPLEGDVVYDRDDRVWLLRRTNDEELLVAVTSNATEDGLTIITPDKIKTPLRVQRLFTHIGSEAM